MNKERVILHCDLNNFYASVEVLRHPEYRGLPLAVAGDPKKRTGIILAKNTLAKEKGIKTGEVIWKAKQLCPNLICVSPNHDEYAIFSKAVKEIYLKYTNFVEPFGIDECWLDVTHSQKLFGNGVEIANKIKEEVKEKTGLTISVGVSFSKMFAKLGSKLGKNDTVSTITKDDYKTKAWKLPVEKLIFVGRNRLQILKKLNIHTIGDLANADETVLSHYFGVSGKYLKDIANGQEEDEVSDFNNLKEIKSIGNGTTSIIDIDNLEQTKQLIYHLSETVSTRLREHHLAALTINLAIKDDNLETTSHSTTINIPTNSVDTIAKTSISLLNKCWNFNTSTKKIRAIRISCSQLFSDAETSFQANLFTDTKKLEKLSKKDQSIDKIRQKYGFNKIKKALLIQAKHINTEESDDFI